MTPQTAVLLLVVLAAGPSAVVYPPQRIPIRFDHRSHLATGLECDWCHEDAADSVRAADLLLPREETCLDCHDPEDPAAPANRCVDCHVGYSGTARGGQSRPARWDFPTARLPFPHRLHTRAEIGCEDCHAGIREAGLATVDHLPDMGACLDCHESRGVSTRCGSCHPTRPDGLLRTEFGDEETGTPERRPETRVGPRRPSKRLMPLRGGAWAHDDTWLTRHGPAAAAEPAFCEACHAPDQCRGCHAGVVRPVRAHPDDWVLLHPLAARAGSQECQSCHRLQTFCRDCHRRTRVVSASEDAELRFPASSQFHPAGWAASGGLSPDHHGLHARRAPATCASCHSERTCTRCHATAVVGGLGLDPHPAGFSDHCGDLIAANPRPCRTCHGEAFRCGP